MLPNFIVIGARKAGTTSLAAYIGAHPDAFVSKPKEPHFFNVNWGMGVPWYESLFAEAGGSLAIGEASTGYTMQPWTRCAASRIASLLPDVRLVYLIRNPIDRLRSMWVWQVNELVEYRPFESVVFARPDYLDISRYGRHLQIYLEHFSREQILVVRSEDLHDRRTETMSTVFDFLGLDPSAAVTGLDVEYNAGTARKSHLPAVNAVARTMRKAHITQLVPAAIRKPARRALARPIPKPKLTDATIEAIWDALAPDLACLRQIVGPEMDLWGRA